MGKKVILEKKKEKKDRKLEKNKWKSAKKRSKNENKKKECTVDYCYNEVMVKSFLLGFYRVFTESFTYLNYKYLGFHTRGHFIICT